MTDILGLRDKVAVVTGGGGNIGTATSRMLAQCGARVLVVDIDHDRAQRSADAAQEAGSDAFAMTADSRSPEDIAAFVSAAVRRWGGIDVGINIVGGGVRMPSTALDTPDEDWAAALDMNLYSTIRCSRAYAKVMLQNKVAGSIVNIASPAGLRAAPNMAAYGVAKAAVINLTHTLAVELGPSNIRANVVVPAWVPAPGVNWGGTQEQQAELARRNVPMGRVTRAEDVAGAIIAFASDLTSFSTGQMIVCDGGRLLTNPINTGALPS